MFCHQCGKEVLAGARFCSSCGTDLTSGQAPALPAGPSTTPLQVFVLFLCLGFGIVLFLGSGFAEMEVGEGKQFLGVIIYDFVLGAGFITSAVLFMLRHRLAPYLARIVALVYIGCTVVNEIVQLAHGQPMFEVHKRLTPQRAVWDILFWSFFPALIVILSQVLIRKATAPAGTKETSP